MLQVILDFLGIEYSIDWTPELVGMVLPVILVIACAFSLFMFICFFQFLYKLIKPNAR